MQYGGFSLRRSGAGSSDHWAFPAYGTGWAQTAAMLIVSPIIEADLPPEQYAYRPGRSALDAVNQVHRLVNIGHREIVDADLSDYFGQIPHAELLKSVARRVSDGPMLGLGQGMAGDGGGGRRREGRHTSHEPGASGAQGDPAGGTDIPDVE